jgi:putative tryptophan/tyrosine transport system substrate-binding protein
MRRRDFITILGGAAATRPLAARAQQSAQKMLRIGTVSALQQSSPQWAAFMRRMGELGYWEGKTFSFEFVSATNEEEYETGYRILAAREPDIILATGPELALKSALAATRTLPIVMIAIDYDPFAFQIISARCSLWVKSRHGALTVMSVIPPKADIAVDSWMSALCQ